MDLRFEYFLWVIVVIGLWNIISLIARTYYKQFTWSYVPIIALGFYAFMLLEFGGCYCGGL